MKQHTPTYFIEQFSFLLMAYIVYDIHMKYNIYMHTTT